MRAISASVVLFATGAGLSVPAPARAVLSLFETPGITIGNDAVECVDHGTFRSCESDALTERSSA